MGLLDSILGGGSSQNSGLGNAAKMAAVAAIFQWVNSQPGGLPGVIERLRTGGLGSILGSWTGQGANEPVEPQHLGQVAQESGLDISSLASLLGTDQQGALNQLSQFLPGLVDKATPQGEVDESQVQELNNVDTSQISNLFDGIFGNKK